MSGSMSYRNQRRAGVATVLGLFIALSSANHGVFEIFQGNESVPGRFIEAIGPAWRMWEHGSEPALTLWPTYLSSGVAAIAAGVAIALCSLFLLRKPRGAWAFLAACAASFVSGGGVAQLPLICVAFTMARLSRRSPGKAVRSMAPTSRGRLAAARPWFLGLAAILTALTLETGAFGYVPGITDPDRVLAICLGSIVAALVCFGLAYFSSSAADLEEESV